PTAFKVIFGFVLGAFLFGGWAVLRRMFDFLASIFATLLLTSLVLTLAYHPIKAYLERKEKRKRKLKQEIDLDVERLTLESMRMVNWKDVPEEAKRELEALDREKAARRQE